MSVNEGSPGLDAHEVDVARFLWCYAPCLFSQSILNRNSCETSSGWLLVPPLDLSLSSLASDFSMRAVCLLVCLCSAVQVRRPPLCVL